MYLFKTEDKTFFTKVTFSNNVIAIIPKIIQSKFNRLGVEYYSLPKLFPPLCVSKDKVYFLNFVNGCLSTKRYYIPSNIMIFLLDTDRALFRKVYGLKLGRYINDKILKDIDLDLIAQDTMNMSLCRIYKIEDKIQRAIYQLSYSDRLELSDSQIIIGQVLTDEDTRYLSGNKLMDSIICREIKLPFIVNKVRLPAYDYYIDTLSTPQSEMSGQIGTLCNGVKIKGNRITKGDSLFSEHVSEVLTHPQNIKPERIPIIHATISQSVDVEANEYPLVQNKNFKGIVNGVNVFAALMDYGYTSNDSTIISETMAKKLKSKGVVRQRVIIPTNNFNIYLNKDDTIIPNQVIMSYENPGLEIINIKANNCIVGKVKSISLNKDYVHNKAVNIITFEYIERFDLIVGSKIAGVHSNKHIVAYIAPDDEMPVGDFGRVDAIFSPATIGKRKNISYLIEGILGHLAKDHPVIVEPFNHIPLAEIMSNVSSQGRSLGYNIPEDFQFNLSIREKRIKHKMFVGKHFITRLIHHPIRKLHYSNKFTNTPNGITIAKGIQRLSRDEVEIMSIIGAEDTIEELRSDKLTHSREVQLGTNLLESYEYMLGNRSIPNALEV